MERTIIIIGLSFYVYNLCFSGYAVSSLILIRFMGLKAHSDTKPTDFLFQVPGESTWVGGSPILKYLIKCGFIKEKNNGLSTDDIFENSEISAGQRKLEQSLGSNQKNIDKLIKNLVKTNKCPNTVHNDVRKKRSKHFLVETEVIE